MALNRQIAGIGGTDQPAAPKKERARRRRKGEGQAPRDPQIAFRCTPAQRDNIKALAAASGLKIREYILGCIDLVGPLTNHPVESGADLVEEVEPAADNG